MESGVSMTSRVFRVAPEQPFLETLADGLRQRWGGGVFGLGKVTLFLPNQRACWGLQEVFQKKVQTASFLPRLRALGDIGLEELTELGADEHIQQHHMHREVGFLPNTLHPLSRRFLVMTLLAKFRKQTSNRSSMPVHTTQDYQMSIALLDLADRIALMNLTTAQFRERLTEMLSEQASEYAQHWKDILKFLEIVTHYWPQIEKEHGTCGEGQKRRETIERLIRRWEICPPGDPVVIAGSTGIEPTVGNLIKTVAGFRNGAVVLAGLQTDVDQKQQKAFAHEPTHPQWPLHRLLKRLDLSLQQVEPWTSNSPLPSQEREARRAFMSAALHPAAAPPQIERVCAEKRRQLARGVDDIVRVDFPNAYAEALGATILLQEIVAEKDKTAAIVTPNDKIARTIASLCAHRGIRIKNSAGQPLSTTLPGNFLRLLAGAAAEPTSSKDLLALLQSPFISVGRPPSHSRRMTRLLDKHILRRRQTDTHDAIAETLAALLRKNTERPVQSRRESAQDPPLEELRRLETWLSEIFACLRPLTRALQDPAASLETCVRAHLHAAEALARTQSGEAEETLWARQEGKRVYAFMQSLLEAAKTRNVAVSNAHYDEFFSTLSSSERIYPRYDLHSRVQIVGRPLEMRLLSFDRLILTGFDATNWPKTIAPNPWLSLSMQKTLGLGDPRERIALASLDFYQALCNCSQVFLTYAQRTADGEPAEPSRWWLRIESLESALCEVEDVRSSQFARRIRTGNRERARKLQIWQKNIRTPSATIAPIEPPEPRPPADVRPRTISATAFEQLRRNPYGYYARYILGIKELPPLGDDQGPALWGSVLHRILEKFALQYPAALPARGEEQYHRIAWRICTQEAPSEAIRNLWMQRFRRVLPDLWREEQNTRNEMHTDVFAEQEGTYRIACRDGVRNGWILRARSDRIDLYANRALDIVNYKTGAIASGKSIERGFSPQLPFEALVMHKGDFNRNARVRNVGTTKIGALIYWRFGSGRRKMSSKEAVSSKGIPLLLSVYERNLCRVLDGFAQESQPFLAHPFPKAKPMYDSYAHLARLAEWGEQEPDYTSF